MILFSNRDDRTHVTVGGHEYEVVRARLGKHIVLGQLRRNRDIRGYLEECGVSAFNYGLDCLRAYHHLVLFNEVRVDLPFLKYRESAKSPVAEETWEYEGRWVASWIHQVAYAYHWSLHDILDLVVEDFFALLQEILLHEQLDKEWQYSLTEVAYPYDKGSNTRRFKPLERPTWMRRGLKQNPVYKEMPIPQGLMPMGPVTDLSALMNASKS